ncbi:LysR family transcriptional regulator [Rhizobium sp. G187]|uniref:LysR family transcriptional regulator n=1 Tax=Rhizobium sp. G187 TaxID=3451352 RepID=UPI003EE4A44E
MDFVDGIRVFVATVETGSFSGAAARLGMSPKLASKYMAELEQRLGTRLLQRTTRRLGMTAAGETLIQRAPDWLADLDVMTSGLRETKRGLSGTLRISASIAYGELRLMQVLSNFRSAHPDLTIDLRLSDRYVDLAAEGIDLAIRIGRLNDSALVARRLGRTTLQLVAAPSYLDRMGRPMNLDALETHNCIRDTNLRGNGSWPLQEGGVLRLLNVRGSFMVNSPRIACDLARNGEGISLCPDYVVHDDLATGALEHVLPTVCGPELDIHAVYLGQRRLSQRTRAFLDYLGSEQQQLSIHR